MAFIRASDYRQLLAGLMLLLISWSPAYGASFDHDATRFPLQGFHRFVECETCHVNGRFKGTPMDCVACHGGSSLIPGGGKTIHHMPTTNACSDCHRPEGWQIVTRFDHSQVMGSCGQCHNGIIQPGKPANHIVSSNQCDSCHNTLSWNRAQFDHSGITQPCSTCHNGSTATGKPANHIQTTAECGTCHNTRAWLPATFDHRNITGSCSTCHNGSTATGKSSGHFVTNRDCNYCHTVTSWTPLNFTHHSSGYPGEHRIRLNCNDCHVGNVEGNVWKYPAYQPDCAGCHANQYRSDPHTKVDTPRIYYNVSELRDCTGACHIYTDSTFTTVKSFRTGHHRVTDSGFGD